MDTFYEIKPGLLKKSALALGFFDGVHQGHKSVIATALAEAQRLEATPAIITFKEHPRALTLGKPPLLLTLIEQRQELFASMGIEATLVLTFTEELCLLSPEEYVKKVLVDCMGAVSLSIGFNHRFGRNREGDGQLLSQLGLTHGYSVHVAPEIVLDTGEVSSSAIRESILKGDLERSCQLLSRPYTVLGNVRSGDGRGRLLGFPTANISTHPEQMLPCPGVYVGIVCLSDRSRRPCVVNVGHRPTFGNGNTLTVEAHLLDFCGDLYDMTLSLEFLHFLRGERKFSSIDELKGQITADCQAAADYFVRHPEFLLQPLAQTI